jgi:glycosyltransferase involved in cell wall biosynthesis
VKKLKEKGHKVKVLTHRFPQEQAINREENLEIYRIPLIQPSSPKYSIQTRFDILFSSFFRKIIDWSDIVYIPRLWYTAIPFIKNLGKPVLVHLHDYLPICPLSTRYDLAKNEQCQHRVCRASCIIVSERYKSKKANQVFLSSLINSTIGQPIGPFVKFADSIVFVSKKHMEVTINKSQHLKRKSKVVYNQMPKIPKAYTNSDDFGYFGGLSVIKGLPVLYSAIDTLRDKGVKIPKIHATKMITNYYHPLKRRSSGLVQYGRLSVDEFTKMYRRVQTVIVPSVWQEPLAYVVAEALMSGRLVIGSKAGGIPELMEGCKGAFLVEADNNLDLAEKIEQVNSKDRVEKRELGEKNIENLSTKLDNDKNIDTFIKILYETIES